MSNKLKEIEIKYGTYFFGDIINTKNFDQKVLIEKAYKNILIY